MEKRTIRKRVWIFILLCIPLGNIMWWMIGDGLQTGEIKIMIISAAIEFIPSVIALTLCVIHDEKLRLLKIRPNMKKSWKVYLLAIALTVVYVYLDDPIQLMLFRGNMYLQQENMLIVMLYVIYVTIAAVIVSGFLVAKQIGWFGYLFPKLEKLHGTNLAILLLSVIQTIWYLVYSLNGYYPIWDICDSFTIALFTQCFFVYLIKKSDSLFPAAIACGMINALPNLGIYNGEFYEQHKIEIFFTTKISVVIVGVLCYFLMRKENMIVKKDEDKVNWLGQRVNDVVTMIKE